MKRILFLIALTVLGLTARGQLDPDCPGFRNTTSFSTGSSFYYWTARVGDRISSGASTGYTVYSTCAASNCPDITGHNNIMAASLNTGSSSTC